MQHLSSTTKELLRDESFILWCIEDTSDSDSHWDEWLEKNPDKKACLEQAKKTVLSIQLNDYKMPQKDSQQLFSRIRSSLEDRQSLRRKRRLRIIYRYAAAACVAALMSLVGTWIYFSSSTQNKDLYSAFLASTIDSECKEIEITFDNGHKTWLKNNPDISLNADGSLSVDGENMTSKNKDRMSDKKYELIVPKNRQATLKLHDGTTAKINSGTIVHFPTQFETYERTIFVDGEVFLDVFPNRKSPFQVKTTELDIRVLGTTFNVSTYHKQKMQQVVLVEGSVLVSNKTGKSTIIKPGEMLSLDSGTMKVEKVDTYSYTFWKDGNLVFDRKKLEYVFEHLGRYYNMHFEITPEIRDYVCSGNLILFDDVESVMKTLYEGFPLTYEINGDTIKVKKKKTN